MKKKPAVILAILLLMCVGWAEAFIDNFDTPHDFKTAGVEGTAWDAMFGSGDPDALLVEIADGELTMASQGTFWNPDYDESGDYGPFLYINVTGDFRATTRVTGFAGAVGAQVFSNYGGIQARTAGGELINNEDIVQICYFPTWTGHVVWIHNDNAREEIGFTVPIWVGDSYATAAQYPFLQLERIGSDFHFRISSDGSTWIPLTEQNELYTGTQTPVVRTRDDMPETLQVGLMHGMASSDPDGFIKYDFFQLQSKVLACSGAPIVKESGETSAEFTVRLIENNGPPDADVLITVTPYALESADAGANDPNDILLAGASGPGLARTVVIAAGDWDVPQTMSVSAVDDMLPEGPEQIGLRFEVSSDDPDYDMQLETKMLVRVVDNDAPDIYVEVSDGGTLVSESGGTDQLAISLATQPAGEVTVSLASPAGQVEADPQELTFGPDNWQDAQPVTISAVDDAVVESDPHAGSIDFGFSSAADSGYAALTNVPGIGVEILENDCGAWGYGPLDRNEDCLVNLADFAEFAQLWLACTMPNDPACADLR